MDLNKKNALLFADHIFGDKDGKISYTKLCSGVLRDGKDGKKRLHCALGEAYVWFIKPEVERDYLKKISRERITKEEGKGGMDGDEGVSSEGTLTNTVAKLIADSAKLKSENKYDELLRSLVDLASTNDDSEGEDAGDYFERARSVAENWTENVVPLLK